MKTLIASVLFACSLSLTSTVFAQSGSATSGTTTSGTTISSTPHVETKFWVVSGQNGKVDVNVVKSAKLVSVNLVDQFGRTLASKTISKGESATRTRFDMNELPDGTYKVILIEGNHTQEKDIELNTHSAETTRTVSLT